MVFLLSAPVSFTGGIYIHKLHFCFCPQTLQRKQSVCTVHDLPDRFKEHEFVQGERRETHEKRSYTIFGLIPIPFGLTSRLRLRCQRSVCYHADFFGLWYKRSAGLRAKEIKSGDLNTFLKEMLLHHWINQLSLFAYRDNGTSPVTRLTWFIETELNSVEEKRVSNRKYLPAATSMHKFTNVPLWWRIKKKPHPLCGFYH